MSLLPGGSQHEWLQTLVIGPPPGRYGVSPQAPLTGSGGRPHARRYRRGHALPSARAGCWLVVAAIPRARLAKCNPPVFLGRGVESSGAAKPNESLEQTGRASRPHERPVGQRARLLNSAFGRNGDN